MLYTIMKYINNFFPTNKREERNFIIDNGSLSLPFPNEAYVLIEGSLFNDGVYQLPLEGLKDEEFNGCITLLAPPKSFLALATEIGSFVDKDVKLNGYTSESFGGYSYTKATGSTGGSADWQDVFRGRLNVWRKI